MSEKYIETRQEFRNYMLGVINDLDKLIDSECFTEENEKVVELYDKLKDFVRNKCTIDTPVTFARSSFEYKGKTYGTVELYNFHTADNVDVEYGIFTDTDFMDLSDDSLEYRMLDNNIYGYLPKKFIEKGTEEEIREYIRYEIG